MPDLPAQVFKDRALRALTTNTGVYALCDLDEVPVYIGQSTDGIRARVRRHLTSARSDVIANRQIDVWEIAYVWAWPIDGGGRINALEQRLIVEFNERSPLVNADIPSSVGDAGIDIPAKQTVQVIETAEIQSRRDPVLRFPRQVQHFGSLVDYVLNTQDKPHLRRAMDVYKNRMLQYYANFID